MHKIIMPVLSGAALIVSHPAQSTTPELPPPYMDVSTLQLICSERFERSSDAIWLTATGKCRGYIQAIVDRYFETENSTRKRQIIPQCDWVKTTDDMIAEVRKSVDGPMSYSMNSRAEPWLRAMLSKKCQDKR